MLYTNIIQWNVRGVKNKIDELKILLDQATPECVCLQETKLPLNEELCISGFNTFLKSVDGERAHGGVAILVNNMVPAYEIVLNTSLQAIAVSIKLHI